MCQKTILSILVLACVCGCLVPGSSAQAAILEGKDPHFDGSDIVIDVDRDVPIIRMTDYGTIGSGRSTESGGSEATIPEPASVLLAVVAGSLLTLGRRRSR